ncbi:MAG: hypothetical protein OJI70_13240, partial [Zavarzinia sp.]|nr:hypothetical protein [Zavarzinia sp.]
MALISGTTGNDRLLGTADADTIEGLDQNDQLFGKEGDDTLTGGDGDDRLDGGTGADALTGGLGNDIYVVDDVGDTVTEAVGEGRDTVTASVSYTLAAGQEIERFVAGGAAAIDLTGNEFANAIYGNDAANTLIGGGGGDNLYGRGGDDILTGGAQGDLLDGGAGADIMTGGAGDDTYIVDDAGDVVVEAKNGGDDRVLTSVSYTLGATADIERLSSKGSAAIDLTGNDRHNQIVANDAVNVLSGGGGDDRLNARGGDDTLIGGQGNDELIGGTGADAMAGGADDDTYHVDDAGDTVVELAGEGADRVLIETTWTLGAGQSVEQLIARGSADIDITGNELANEVFGNAGANVLSGGGGDDRLNARDGDDTLIGGQGDDTLIGGTGADAMAGGTENDTYYVDDAGDTVTELVGEGSDRVLIETTWTLGAGQSVEQLIARGSADIDVTGNELANEIFGNAGANVLSGGGGDDTIHGAAGDTLDGGFGADTYLVTGGGTGTIRVIGEAADSLSTTDTGWQAAGTALLDGLLVKRFVNGNVTMTVDAAIDTSGVQTAFGATVTTAGYDRQVIDLTSLSAAQGFIIQGDTNNDQAGRSVSSAGDVNGDGFDDLIVGAPYGDDAGSSAGETYVVFGAAGGFGTDVGGRQVIDLTTLSAAQGFLVQGDVAGDQAGRSVSSAGDVNGDGYDDLIVGAPYGEDGGSYAGEAYVIFGAAGGFGTDVGGRQVIDLTTLTAAQGFIIQADTAGDYTGWSVSSAGDVNGD